MKLSISGSFSVGKSTLFRVLKKRVEGYDFINEISREVMKEMNTNNQTMSLEERILHQRLCVEKQIQREAQSQNFITDYCTIDNLNYSYGLGIYDEVRELVIEHLKKIGGYDIIFYVPIQFPLEKDGVRYENREFQKEIDTRLKKLLKEFNLPFVEITGNLKNRVEKVLSFIKNPKYD